MNRLSTLCWVVLLAFCLSLPVAAQTTTGNLTGDITDPSGARLPGVAVKATSQQTGTTRETITNEFGTYRLTALPPATYTLTAELSGFKTVQRTVSVGLGATATINIQLEVASVAENLMVTEEAPLIETMENAVKTLIDTRHIEELPLKSRNFMDLALLSPGVQMDQGAAAGGQVTPISFGGLDARFKSIWLEGVDFNDEVTSGGSTLSDPTRISLAQEAIQEFQVMANSYSTEFGRSAGGVINIVSKSGGNSYHGNGFYFRRDDRFSKPPFSVQNGITTPLDPEPVFKIQQFGGTLGGPIKKDRAHFFGSYERQLSNKTVNVSIPSAILNFVKGLGYDTETNVPVDTKVNNYFGKLTFDLAPAHTLNLSYLYDKRLLPNQQVSGTSSRDHGYNDDRMAYFLVGNLTSLFGANTVNEARFSRSIQKLNRIVPGKFAPQLTFPSVSFGQATNIPQSRTQYNWVFVDTFSRHFTGFFGQHDLKAGGQFNQVKAFGRINNTYEGNFTFLRDLPVIPNDPACTPFTTACSLPAVFALGIDLHNNNALIERSVNVYYLFANDAWRITPRLTLNVGLRYDYQQWEGDLAGQPYPAGVSQEQLWARMIGGDLKGINYVTMPSPKREWSPRIGFSWDARGNGRTVIRAGYGIYRDRINTTTLRGVIDGYNGITTTNLTNDSRTSGVTNTFFPNVPATSSLPAAGGSSFSVPNPAGRFPYTQQFTIGGQQQVMKDWAVAVDEVHTLGIHFNQNRNVNAPINGVYPLLAGRQRLTLLDASNIVKIDQLQVRVQGKFAGKLTLMSGYTLGKAYSYADTPTDAYNLKGDWGPTANDVRHRLTTNLLYSLPYDVRVSGIYTYNTAPPYNITLGTANKNDGGNTARAPGVDFNSGRGDDFRTLDLRFSKVFKIKESKSIEGLWEMFNVGNTRNLIQYQGNQATLATFGKPRSALDAMQGQFGLKFNF